MSLMVIATIPRIRQQAFIAAVSALVLLIGLNPTPTQAQIGSSQKISNSAGEFSGTLNSEDFFGVAVADLGDLNDDGKREVAVGAPATDGGGTQRGALWILSLNDDGTVDSEQQIDEGDIGGLNDFDRFGTVANAGDINDDGTTDLAVGATGDEEGAVWILFLEPDNTGAGVTVSDFNKITNNSVDGGLDGEDRFGNRLSGIGDLNGDGTPDLAVGADGDDDGGTDRGAVWILFLNSGNNGDSAGTVASFQKISDVTGGFGGTLVNDDQFHAVSEIGDLNDDSVQDLAVGATGDNDGGSARGAVWILFMNTDGTVSDEQKISDTAGSFGGTLTDNDAFGFAAAPGDLDGDGTPDLLVGAPNDDEGAIWVLYLDDQGTVDQEIKIGNGQGGFEGALDDADRFGSGLTALGDLNGDNNPDLAVGAPADDDGASEAGALWTMFGDSPSLPVELASFDGTQSAEQSVQLEWTTTSETNNAGFVLQHKAGLHASWSTLGFVESNAAGGTTTEAQTYRFTAEDLQVGTHEFRLKQRDLDGTTTTYDPVTVELQMEEVLRLSAPAPNPVQDRASLSFAVKEQAEATITVYNALGQKVRTLYHGTPTAGEAQTARFSTDGLSSGVYVLRLRADGRAKTERVTVVR